MNERSEQFKKYLEARGWTREYRRHTRWLRFRLWLYNLFHKGSTDDT